MPSPPAPTTAAPTTALRTATGDGIGWFYAAAALVGAITLSSLLAWYPYEDMAESIGKFVSSASTIASLLCLAALWQRRRAQTLAAIWIIIGGFGVAWAASFTALPDPPAALGDAQNDLRMVAAGFAAGGGLGLLFTVLRGDSGRPWAHVPLIFAIGVLGIATTITLVATAPDAFPLAF